MPRCPARTLQRFVALLSLCSVCVFAQTALAQENPPAASAPSQQPATSPDQITAVPNRPTIASTGEITQRGVLELEYGFEGGDGHQDINGLVKFGLTPWLELRVANNPVLRVGGVLGTGDSGAGFKLRLAPQKNWRPTLSLLYGATLPTANNGLGAGTYGHSIQLLVSKDFGKHHFDFNEGIQLVGRPEFGQSGYDRNYFTALAWSHPLRGKWGVTAEVAGFSRTNGLTPATMTILSAATYSVSSRLILDAGAYAAAYGNLPRVTAFFGVTYAIADLYRGHGNKAAAK